MLIVHGQSWIGPDIRDEWSARAKENVIRVRGEGGCVLYTYANDLLEADLMHTFEVWTDQAAFDRHVANPDHRARVAKNRELGATAHEVKIYDVSGVRDYLR